MGLYFINSLYIFLVIIISVYGLYALFITIIYLTRYSKETPVFPAPEQWPSVAVQIPLYNEESVAERIIDRVCAFQYPKESLKIQILDDSTDNTTEKATQRAAYYRALGNNIEVIHRVNRNGFKAGALEEGLARTNAEFVAVFDADFLPPQNYLQRVIPPMVQDPGLGMVQVRWGHINTESNLLTRAQSLFLDGHQVVEQVARSRSGLLCNFNGSGGTWRTACIQSCGGWQSDTLSEDIDLSFRAQMKGWKLTFIPEDPIPGEIPPLLSAFKQQQYRWNYGYAQVMKKHFINLIACPTLNLRQRIFGIFHITANLTHILGLLLFLLSVPLAFFHPRQPSSLGLISIATSGPSILFAVAQLTGYQKDSLSKRISRLLFLPILVLMSIGTSVSNSHAVILALNGKKFEFIRTPKFNLTGSERNVKNQKQATRLLILRWMEFLMMIYSGFGLSLAITRAPELISLTLIGVLSFSFVFFSELAEDRENQAFVGSKKGGESVEIPSR